MFKWHNSLIVVTIIILMIALFALSGGACTSTNEATTQPALEPKPIPDNEQTQPTEPAPEPKPIPDNEQKQPPNSGQDVVAIIATHQCTDISEIPLQWINIAKSNLKVWYGHTSHGGQITTGMENLESHYGSPYNFNEMGSDGALSYQEVWADVGHNGDLTWEKKTRNQLNQPGNDRNVVIWSWCRGVSDNSVEGIDIYLNAMNQLEIDYPNVTFIYMTGHLDGTGESGNLNVRNNQIRRYCIDNNKVLFDFADIESYDPDGNYFLDLNANDNCDYDGGNWAQEWCAENPNSDLCWPTSCAHTQALNCNLKGRAFWWMLARIAGWEGL